MLAPSASEPTTVPLVLGVARTFRLVPEVLTVPLAEAQAEDIGATAAISNAPAATTTADLPNRRGRAEAFGRSGLAGNSVVLPSMVLLRERTGDKAGVIDVSGIVYPISDSSMRLPPVRLA
jgi:hypothetical protein